MSKLHNPALFGNALLEVASTLDVFDDKAEIVSFSESRTCKISSGTLDAKISLFWKLSAMDMKGDREVNMHSTAFQSDAFSGTAS